MAVEVTTLELNARLTNAEQTIAGLQRMGAAGKQAELSLGAVGKQILGFGTAAGAAVLVGQKLVSSLVDMGKQSVVLAASFEKSRMTWGVLVGDMDKGAKVFDKLYQFSAKSPLSFEGINQAATTIKGFGVATDSLIPTLTRLGDLAMGDNAKLSQLALVYGQVFAQGKAKTQDLYQFINAGVPIFNMLAESMGKSSGEIKEIAATGAVTFDEIEKAITKATSSGGQFFNMGETIANSASGKWVTAQDKWNQQLAKFGENILPMVTRALDAATSAMDRWNSARSAEKKVGSIISFSDLVAYGDSAGASKFISENAGADFNMVRQAIALAESSNPNPTKAQAQALAAAKAALQDFINRGKLQAAGVYGDTGLVTSGSAPGGNPGRSGGEPGIAYGTYGYTDPRRAGMHYVGPGMDVTDNVEFYQPETIVGQGTINISDMARGRGGMKPLIHEATELDKIMKDLKTSMAQVGASSIVSSFDAIGKALAEGANGGQSLAQSMQSIVSSAASQTGALMINAGLTAMLNPATFWMGVALFTVGGGMEIIGGAMSAGNSSSGMSSGASSADIAALTAYYQKTEAFNAAGRNVTRGYASGTNYAMSGWAWVGERGPELMRVPQGAQIVPNHRIRGYADGLNVPQLGNMTVNILPPSGYEAVQTETSDASGRAVEVAFRRIVRDEVSKMGGRAPRRVSQ